MMHKDTRLALEAGTELDAPLPSTRAADQMLTRAEELGYEHRDLAALLEVLEKTSAATAV
jgi:3-hydroxyisobutyrate dehydrogenase-like beta-hydroxyacid dehydrogenase